MIAGLLHDLGKVVLAHLLPAEYNRALQLAADKRCHIGEAEREVFGVNHALVAEWAGRSWHLPTQLINAFEYHHRPSRCKEAAHIPAIIHIADILARGMGYGDGGDATLPPFDQEAWRQLAMDYGAIETALDGVEQEFRRGSDFFLENGARK